MRFALSFLLFASLNLFGATFNWTNTFTPAGKQYNAGDTVNFWGSNWVLPTFVLTNSGTPGNPITFQWQPGCSITYTSLVAGGIIIELSTRHDLVFDGGSGASTPLAVSLGLTDNGTTSANPPGTNTYGAQPTYLINAYNNPVGATNVVFQNLTFRGNYNRMGFTNAGHFDSACLRIQGINITVSNCFFGESDDGVFYGYSTGSASNITVIANQFTNFNHGITIATSSDSSFLYDTLVSQNGLYSGDMYETKDGLDVGLHRDPIFFFSEAPFPARNSMMSNCVVERNFISQGTLNPQSTTAGTAAIFLDFYRTYQCAHTRIINNISVIRTNLAWSGGQGFVGGWGIDSFVANNTCVSWKTNGVYGGGTVGYTAAGTNSYGYNNIIISQGGAVAATQCDVTGKTTGDSDCVGMLSGVWSDFNIFNGQGNNSFVAIIYDTNTAAFSEPIKDTFGQWQAIYGGLYASHADPHSKTALVSLDAKYMPVLGDTVATLSGTNLTSYGITNDYFGNPRPAVGNWDIGALQNTNTSAGGGPPTTINGQSNVGGKHSMGGRITK